jgi:hypothetical protein
VKPFTASAAAFPTDASPANASVLRMPGVVPGAENTDTAPLKEFPPASVHVPMDSVLGKTVIPPLPVTGAVIVNDRASPRISLPPVV